MLLEDFRWADVIALNAQKDNKKEGHMLNPLACTVRDIQLLELETLHVLGFL